MKQTALLLSAAVGLASLTASAQSGEQFKRVLLISIDGMHAVDFQNCVNGISTVDGGTPYCPALAGLAKTGINYVAASTSKPSDSFPGLTAIVTGGSPALTGVYYDVAYSRTTTRRRRQQATVWRRSVHGVCGADRHDDRIRGRHRHRQDEAEWRRAGRFPDRWWPRRRSIRRSFRAIPNNGCAPVYPVGLCERQQHLQRDPPGGRIHSVVG